MFFIRFSKICISIFICNKVIIITSYWFYYRSNRIHRRICDWTYWQSLKSRTSSIIIVAFAYFYLSISFNTYDVANNLKKNGGTILGYRPGKPTADYLRKVVNRITLIGSIFLSFMAIVPILMAWTEKGPLTSLVFGGTSIIIVVSVALETTRELESEITLRHYKGFLE